MNFDAFWQTHRKFVLGVAGGLVLFLIAEALIGSTARSSLNSAERRIRASRSQLAKRAYDANAERVARQRLEELRRRVDAISAETLPPWRADFQPAAGQSPSQFYIERTGRLRQELIPWVHRANVEVDPSLGMPAVSPTEPQKIEKVLRGLDVVDRVVRLAVASGAREVEDIEISVRARRRRGNQQVALELTPVRMTVVMDEGRTMAFLEEVVSAEPPLGLDRLEVGPLDARRHNRRVALEFSVGAVPAREEDA